MIEKGITVPESYPLTLKALTTGCNQKNNRDPVSNYSEDDVLDTLEGLRELGLAAVVHTESGRTERYRHYLRRRMADLSEPQVAILAELLLRGRQATGDLRARASRMAPAGTLDSLDQLRVELAGLIQKGLAQSEGSLERRGVEVDHNLYEPQEGKKLAQRNFEDEERPPAASAPGPSAHPPTVTSPPVRPAPSPAPGAPDLAGRFAAMELSLSALRGENQELRGELGALRDEFRRLADDLQKLREALGA
jgi:hypothetical protein